MALTNEDLLAISNLLSPIKEDIAGMKKDIVGMQNEILGMRNDITDIRKDISGMQSDIVGTQNDVAGMKNDIAGMKNDIAGMKNDIAELKKDVLIINLKLENDVIPRLQNIESCYISTYDRYREGVEEHEEMKKDIEILKKVVEVHSEKFQQLA